MRLGTEHATLLHHALAQDGVPLKVAPDVHFDAGAQLNFMSYNAKCTMSYVAIQ